MLPYIEDVVLALPDFDPSSPMRACSNLSWQVPDVSLIGSTSNFNLSGGEGGSEAITIAVAVSVLVLLGFCCCWFWYAFRAGKPCCCWSCGCFWFECACRAGLPSDDPAEKNTVFVFAKPHANTPAVLEVIRTKFTEQGIKVLQEGVVTGEEIESKGFMDQHDKFTSPGSSIHYYVVEFNPATLSWADFRGKVLGLTTPADAPTDSLRGIVAANWQKLGLQAPCDDSDNAVHASASPFESLAERTNWFACCVSDDPFGSALLAKGVPEATIKKWSNDPQVKYDDETAKEKGMSKGSIFDALKDLDYKQCLDRCVAINKASAEVLVYQKALDAVNEASKEGADWVKGLNPLVAAVQLAKAKQPARRAFLGAPTNGSYALVTEMGTPPDADCSERARDKVLGFFIAQNTLFMVLAGFCALIIVGFGVAIGVFLLSAIIGVEIFTLSDIYPDCANKTHSIELYLERNPGKFWTERDGVYAPATHNKVDRVFGQGMHKVCTDGQLWFNICIKVFIIVFSYINLLPVPWRFAILCDAYDTDNRNKGQVGLSVLSECVLDCIPHGRRLLRSLMTSECMLVPSLIRSASTSTAGRPKHSGSTCQCTRARSWPGASTSATLRTTSRWARTSTIGSIGTHRECPGLRR